MIPRIIINFENILIIKVNGLLARVIDNFQNKNWKFINNLIEI